MSNDRISCLPDSLVSHILSFLPTKDAVATSVLSKRWKPMWRSTTTLDFNENAHYRRYAHRKNGEQHCRRHFVEFVYAILLSRDVQPIKRFRLCCMAPAICNSSVNKWINHALESQVEHLEISLTTNDDGFEDVYMDFLIDTYNGVLPSISTIFTSNSLVVLKLKWLEFKPLSSVSLPALKVLHLEFCVFPDYRCLRTILSGCCTLMETLILKSVDITNLELTPSQLFNFYHAANYRISFPKLLSARIALITFRELRNIEFLRFLRVDVDFGPAEKLDYSCISTFPYLIHLELCFFEAYSWDVASDILGSTPKLQILSILLHKETNWLDEEDDFVPLKLPSSLTECRMVGLEGKEGEMQFVKFVMENATNLQAFTIRCDVSSNRSGYKLKLKIQKELSSYPRSSSTCRLLFE